MRLATYTVVKGDRLSAIAARYEVPTLVLAALNNLHDPNLIHPGQILVLPLVEG